DPEEPAPAGGAGGFRGILLKLKSRGPASNRTPRQIRNAKTMIPGMAATNKSTTNGKPITLVELAKYKNLPVAFLHEQGLHDLRDRGVGIPYYDDTGVETIAVKRRTKLLAKEGSYWPKGQALVAYGLWRLDRAAKASFIILVEGESDCWALWKHG